MPHPFRVVMCFYRQFSMVTLLTSSGLTTYAFKELLLYLKIFLLKIPPEKPVFFIVNEISIAPFLCRESHVA